MITTGIKGHLQRIVTPELTAAHVGSGLANVFATPMMVALIEETCCQSVAHFLQAHSSMWHTPPPLQWACRSGATAPS